MNARRLSLALVVALASLGLGCDGADKKTKSEAAPADSAKPKTKLEKALEAAAAASATASAQGQGPPANGVFAPGAADAEQAASAPPKLTMVKTGDGPKVTLAPAGLPSGARFGVNVTATAFRGPLPAMVYALQVADDKAKAEGGAPAERPFVIKVKKASVDPKWPGKLQEGGEKLVAKLTGATVSGVIAANGGLRQLKLEVPKDAAEIAPIAEPLVETLDFLFVPVPAEPIAAGTSWLVADRARVAGIDVVRYRAATFQKLDGEVATLSIDVRHYAASGASVPEGLPPGVEALRAESFGQATLARSLGDATPAAAKLSYPFDLVVGKGGTPAGQLRAEVRAEIAAAEAAK